MTVNLTQPNYSDYTTKNKKEENQSNSDFQVAIQEAEKNKESKETKESNGEDMDTLWALAEDIFSLLRTGMTVAEVEALQELLIELKKKVKEGDYSEEEVEKMLSQIERQIQQLKKRVSGEAVIELENTNLKQENTKSSTNGDTITTDFLNRIDKAITQLEELKTGKDFKTPKTLSNNESELLEIIKKFQNKH